jgi:hypothetical protein
MTLYSCISRDAVEPGWCSTPAFFSVPGHHLALFYGLISNINKLYLISFPAFLFEVEASLRNGITDFLDFRVYFLRMSVS